MDWNQLHVLETLLTVIEGVRKRLWRCFIRVLTSLPTVVGWLRVGLETSQFDTSLPVHLVKRSMP